MARPSSRVELKDYILRRLGSPVIDINVSEDQIQDRIDDAVDYWRDYHYDGMTKEYVAYQLTAKDIANKYVSIPNEIFGVTRIFDFSSTARNSSLFDIEYQLQLNSIWDLTSINLSNYYVYKMQVDFINELLSGSKPIRYNRHQNRLQIDMNWKERTPGDFVLYEAYQILDGDTYTDVWNDRFLKQYATALVKKQWGENISKFEGMQLPGGVTFNGQQIKQEAVEEIQKLEEEMIVNYSLPVADFIG